MDFINIAKSRSSVRDYNNKKVEPEKLEKILEAAHVAPTAANLQPVHLIVVQSEEGLAKLVRPQIFMEHLWRLLSALTMTKHGYVRLMESRLVTLMLRS